jgi:3-carboxy-cis,cis-muconate cycloisomerase
LTSDGLLAPIFTTAAMREAVGDRALLQAMLDGEAALALAEARAGVIPHEAAQAIAACCVADRFDMAELGRQAAPAGNPVIPLVRALTASVPGAAARYVHWGATSQDILDSALMLLIKRALPSIEADLTGAAAACAGHAAAHRATLMPGRTLLQQASPITFGLKAAGWLAALVEVRQSLAAYQDTRLAVQLGGASGTLASLGSRGLEVLRELAGELGLAEPALPWHTARARIAELGAALGITAGVLGKIALDVALLAQTEVAEVAEPAGEGRGGSSTLPHKRNPVGATAINAGVRRVHGLAGVLLGCMVQEHERAAGAWQAEWETLREALLLTAGAAAWAHDVLRDLEVYPERMRSNLETTHGLIMAEHVTMVLAESIGRREAHEAVESASRRAAGSDRPLRDELLGDQTVTSHLTPQQIDAALDPSGYLGSALAFIDRALAAYQDGLPHGTPHACRMKAP